MNAVFLDFDTVSDGSLDTTSLAATVDTLELCRIDLSKTAARLSGADIAMTNKVELTRDLLTAAPRLKLVAVAGTGTNHIDMAAARELGIGVCNVPGYCTSSVAQHTWALILGLTRHLAEYDRMVRERAWTDGAMDVALSHPIRELDGRVLGVIGWGELGRATARVAPAFGMSVLVAQSRREAMPGAKHSPAAGEPARVELDRLLRASDVVSLHCPLTDATRGMIGAREIGLMKPGALLINTARAGLVDTAALRDALKSGHLGGAGVDVFAPEPPRDDDPLLEPGIPRLIVSPHVAWAAVEARQRCIDEMTAGIASFLGGGRRSRVD